MKTHKHYLSLFCASVLTGLSGITAAQAAESHYFGRWTVSDEKPVYTAKGKRYKTFDVAPCGNDFCGISVGENDQCGETLFRFLTVHADMGEVVGHGLWGDAKKKLIIDYNKPDTGADSLYIGLGADDMDLSGREGSVPSFDANYKRVGKAVCLGK